MLTVREESNNSDMEDGELETDESFGSETDESNEEESLEQRIQALLNTKHSQSKLSSENRVVKTPTPPLSEEEKDTCSSFHYSNLRNSVTTSSNLSTSYNVEVCNESAPPSAPTVFTSKRQHGQLYMYSFQLLFGDLKRTLFKDLSRRLMEQCAFKQLDSWWIKSEIRCHTKKKEPTRTNILKNDSKPDQGNLFNSSGHKDEPGNVTWDKMFMHSGTFGLKEAIPKLPSFRKKDAKPLSEFKVIERSSSRTNFRGNSKKTEKCDLKDLNSDSDTSPISPSHTKYHRKTVKKSITLSEKSNQSSSTLSTSSTSGDDGPSRRIAKRKGITNTANLDIPSRDSHAITNSIISPQKPKARWAMFVQEETNHPPPIIGSTEKSQIISKEEGVKEADLKYGKQTRKRKQTIEKKPRLSKIIIDSDSDSSAFISSTTESEMIDSQDLSESENDIGTKKSLAAKRLNSSVICKEKETHHRNKVNAPSSPKKPIVKRVNTLTESELTSKNAPNEESHDQYSEENLPSFILDHLYVPLSQLRLIPLVTAKTPTNFKPRSHTDEETIATSLIRLGVDSEDLRYLERSYEELLQNYSHSYYWLNETTWTKHPPTAVSELTLISNIAAGQANYFCSNGTRATSARCDLPWLGGKTARPHGPAGTETVQVVETSVLKNGIDLVHVKSDMQATAGGDRVAIPVDNSSAMDRLGVDIGKSVKAAKAELREARSHQRRLLACFSSQCSDRERDILGFNLLKYRKKRVRFARSGIHGWGLYALEPIAAEEMVGVKNNSFCLLLKFLGSRICW